jgi:L-amino acid N-acyltransferase YncA
MAVGDQGDLSALFNAGHGGVVKHYELGCFLGSHFEGEFYALREEHTGFEGVVLDGEETVLGFGTIIPSRRRHEAHRGVLDLLVHPNYADRFAELLDRLHRESRMEVVTAFVEDSEEARRQAFERAGYRAVGRLEDCLRIGDEVFSLTSYEKRLDRSAG